MLYRLLVVSACYERSCVTLLLLIVTPEVLFVHLHLLYCVVFRVRWFGDLLRVSVFGVFVQAI